MPEETADPMEMLILQQATTMLGIEVQGRYINMPENYEQIQEILAEAAAGLYDLDFCKNCPPGTSKSHSCKCTPVNFAELEYAKWERWFVEQGWTPPEPSS